MKIKMESNELRTKFLKFFEKKGHKILPSSSLIPSGDPSVLFTTAGMQQFKSYYTNSEKADIDFDTKNVVTIQKCIRTGDIEEVGDSTHLTFFEMLGNFSFGGYGKEKAIKYAYDFITKELDLQISYVTVYEGDGTVPKDDDSFSIWKSLGIEDIRLDGGDVFWGPTGESGPCGATTEIYCKNAENEDVEIWNIVFNEYFCNGSRLELDNKKATLIKLEVLGIDTGMGFERLLATLQKKADVYATDLFFPILEKINNLTDSQNEKAKRIIADHIRACVFILSEEVVSSNTGRGYILRRLLRKAVVYADVINIKSGSLVDIAKAVLEKYKDIYPSILQNSKMILDQIKEEESKFRLTLEKGLKEFEKGIDPFILFTTYGFPIELTLELAKEKGIEINMEKFNQDMQEHKKISTTSLAGMFGGGLANDKEETIKLHTAHHLLLAALQNLISPKIKQRGSNINEDRLRIDFLCDHKLTDEEKKSLEDWVNDKIKENLNVIGREMPLIEAQKIGAEMEFGAKYPDKVSVYFIEDKKGNVISKEFCGGPHVTHTKELGVFKIKKEESVASGIRRIKAVLM